MRLIHQRRELDETPFDLTPMVDIVFLLIIFFMLTAQFSRVLLAPMDLPREKGAVHQSNRTHQAIVDLSRDGTLSLNNETIASDRLLQRLAADAKAAGELDILIRADRACDAVHLNRLAAALSAIGIRDWRLATTGGGG
jgi:biopolymer transport protein ExbD